MNFSAFLISSLFASNLLAANVCDQFFTSKSAKKLECQSIGAESPIITSEDRIIFVSKTACIEIESNNLTVNLQNPSNGKSTLDVKKSTSSNIQAKNSTRIYPSGNITKSYVVEESINLSEISSASSKFTVKKVNKHIFKKDELRYIGEYNCSEVK